MESRNVSDGSLLSCRGTVAKKRYLITEVLAMFVPLFLYSFLRAYTQMHRFADIKFHFFIEGVGIILFGIGILFATCNSAKRFRAIGVVEEKCTKYAVSLLIPGVIGKVIFTGLPTRTLQHAEYAPALYSFIGYWMDHLMKTVGSMLLYGVILSICITLYMERKNKKK